MTSTLFDKSAPAHRTIAVVRWMLLKLKTPLGRNTFWIFSGDVCRHCLRAAYFLIVARVMGAEQYGLFVGVAALIGIFVPFASFGSGSLLLKHVSRNNSTFDVYWGNSLFVILTSGSLLLVVGLILAHLLLPLRASTLLIVSVGLADLIFTKILDTSATSFQAFDKLGVTARLYIYVALARLLGAVTMVAVIRRPDASKWAVFYLIAAVVSACLAVDLVTRRLGRARLATRLIPGEVVERFYFSCGQSTETVYNDIDKTMLTQFSALAGAGIYAAAYRVIDVVFVPFNALLWASLSRFFIQGSHGITNTSRYAMHLLSRAVAFVALACVIIFLCAPVLPRLLGPEYVQAVHALRWLAPIPFLRTVHRFLANSLTGAGFQGLRTAAQAAVAVFNILLNLCLIPTYSWRGAAWSSLSSDGLLLLMLLFITVWLRRRHDLLTNNVATTPA